MPIEIRELHIKVMVNAPQEQQSAGSVRAAAPGGNPAESGQSEKEAMVAECVEQVLQILHHKKER